MDALQVVASATQIVTGMIGAVGALEQASRNYKEAPKRIHSLEELVHSLENLESEIRQKHAHKLHNPQLDDQIRSLNSLIARLHPKISNARRFFSRGKLGKFRGVIWSSMTGDPLGKLITSIRDDLSWWLESQKFAQTVGAAIESTARDAPTQSKIQVERGYPLSSKCTYVKDLLERESLNRVILIVGLSGIGKSCLARQVASNPPSRFVDGAVELGFGKWCSRAACSGNKMEYQKRLCRKINKFLVQIGFWKKLSEDRCGDLDYVCCMLQKALDGKRMLVLLDDVWEKDIVERFAKLYDNECRYLVTTRNEAVYEITEAEKVELSKDDIREISKAILIYHSLLSEEELPDAADELLDRCGHHPLTVAVMGRVLRKEVRAEKWEKAISNLSTFATCAPGPVSYVNEKEAENNTLTIFGSFEFSLQAMPEDPRRLFIALAALSWDDAVPESCLEAVWPVLGNETLFPLTVGKLVEGSLLMRSESYLLYHVHDMVSLYLDTKLKDSIILLFNDSASSVYPWLLIFGKEAVKEIAEKKILSVFDMLEENQTYITLKSIIQALMASKSISELEASRATFSGFLGPRIADIIMTGSQNLIAVSAEAIANLFSKNDYCNYFPSLEGISAVHKLSKVLVNSDDPETHIHIAIVLAKLAEFGSPGIVNEVLQTVSFDQLANLLSPDVEEWHEKIFTILMSLILAGKSKAIEKIFEFGIEKRLLKLLESGSEVAQDHAIVTLKAFYELAGPRSNRFLKSTDLNHLPWQIRLRLERFILLDQSTNDPSQKLLLSFEDLLVKLQSSESSNILEAIQDLMPAIEGAGNIHTQDMILKSKLIGVLSELLRYKGSEQNLVKSASAFLLMKLACSGGEACMKKFLDFDIVPELAKMMQSDILELQDSAYTALHQMMFSSGGAFIVSKIFQSGLIERLVQTTESKSRKTREVSVNCILDIVELGNKAYLERLFSLQAVEKLVKLEKCGGNSLVGFIKGLDKCKNLTMAERKVMKQQVLRRVKTELKGHKFESRILTSVDACLSEGSRGSGSGSGSGSGNGRRRKP